MSTTLRSLDGILDADGTVRLSEPCDIKGPVPVVVTLAVETDSDDDFGLEESWKAEFRRRAEQIDNGEVELIEEDDFLKRLRSA